MGTKSNPGKFDCHAVAADDEPLFTLLARDRDAPELVEQWAHWRTLGINLGLYPSSDCVKIAEARECAKAMREWRKRNRPE